MQNWGGMCVGGELNAQTLVTTIHEEINGKTI